MPTLTLAQILTDMETAERGLTPPELARLYNVSSSSVASKLADLYQQRRIDRLRTRRRDEVTGRVSLGGPDGARQRRIVVATVRPWTRPGEPVTRGRAAKS